MENVLRLGASPRGLRAVTTVSSQRGQIRPDVVRVALGDAVLGHVVKNNMFGWTRALAAQPGMTFSNEPGGSIRGEFGVRLEDDMVITADGARLFTPQSESLEKPF